MSQKDLDTEAAHLVVLRKLTEHGQMSMLEIGFNATPQFIRNMAARGLITVAVTITPRGKETFDKLNLKAMRRLERARRQAALVESRDGLIAARAQRGLKVA